MPRRVRPLPADLSISESIIPSNGPNIADLLEGAQARIARDMRTNLFDQATATTNTVSTGREAAMRHEDMVDAMRMIHQADAQRSATAQLMAQRDRGPRVRVEFMLRPETPRRERERYREVRVSTEPMHLALRHEMEREDRVPLEIQHRSIAQRIAREVADAVYEETLRQLIPAENHYQRELDRERVEIYGGRQQGRTWNMLHHGIDVARGVRDSMLKSIPLKAWFKHKKFEFNGWTATLLETEEQIDNEGATMEHCFAASYKRRIAEEKYIGYHITAPEGRGLPRSGFTLGFRVTENKAWAGDEPAAKRFQYDQVKGKRNQTHHVENPELLALIEHIDKSINERPPALNPADIESVEIPREWVGA